MSRTGVPYRLQWRSAIAIAVALVVIGAIQSVGPEQLGIPEVAFRWLGILSAALAAVQSFLPNVASVPDPDHLLNRVSELSGAEKVRLYQMLQAGMV